MEGDRNLKVSERANRLMLEVQSARQTFPKDQLFGLTSQPRRAAALIPANSAAGCRRNGGAELARFLTIAIGSVNELNGDLLLAHELGYPPPPLDEHVSTEAQGVARMLATFVDRLRYQSPQSGDRQPIADSR